MIGVAHGKRDSVKMLNRLSVTKKIGFMAIALIALLVITASTAIVSMSSIGKELESIAHKDMPLIEKLTKVTEYQLEQAIHFERAIHFGTVRLLKEELEDGSYHTYQEHFEKEKAQFLAYGIKVDKQLKAAQTKVASILELSQSEQSFNLFAAHASEHDEFQMISDQLNVISKEHKDFEKHGAEALAAIDDGSFDKAKSIALQVEKGEDQLVKHLEGLLEEIEHYTLMASETALEHEKSALKIIALLLAISLIVGITMSSAIAKNITSRLKVSVEGMKHLADGDLTHTVVAEGSDEIAQMLASQESTRKQLQKIIGGISDTSNQLSATSEEVATTMSATSANIHDQQTQTETLSASMQEMSATSHEVAQNVSHVNDSVDKVDNELKASNQMLLDTVEQIVELSNQLEYSVDTVKELDQSTAQISTVLQVITDIAEQTNLLALNAAIEAARAGEQGRGFSVVADEVRQLASRTQSSTAEITGIIKQLQAGSNRVVSVINETQNKAGVMVNSAKASSDSLTAVTEQLSVINDMTTQIATAAEQQSLVSDDSTQNVTVISDMGHQNAASIEETSQAGLDLARMAEGLNANVLAFKV